MIHTEWENYEKDMTSLMTSFYVAIGLVLSFIAGIAFRHVVGSKDENQLLRHGYNVAVTDIMRYGFYIDADGKKHKVDNIRIWSD